MSPRKGRPRQADIARLAGVSQTVVSLVLSGNPNGVAIAPETRKRVMDTADALGYVADPAARRLVAGRNRLLGVYTFTATFPVDGRDSYYPFLAGFEQEAAAQGYDLLLFTGRDRPERGLGRLRLADGCTLIGRHAPAEELTRLLDDGFPLVYIGRNDTVGDRLPYVGADYTRASADVVAYLTRLGHRKIRYVREHDDAIASADREHGFLLGLEETGVHGEVTRTDGTDLGSDRLRGWVDDGVTAIVVEATDTQAAAHALRDALADAGLRCPADVSVAMLGDEIQREPGQKTLTGFAVPRAEMGRRAARLLVDLLEERPIAARQELLPCPFVAGETTASPDAAAPTASPDQGDSWS